uniref:Integrase catalytic domain-containing protein n=1 Tax=Tanacetum cinerariifolium TaxID=118510 RepID=A0A699IN11_TANCI|nr:hypothetical protein [Tanacetum cinerariifolium]
MTSNISYLSEYEPYDGGYVSFGQRGGKITGKCIIKTGKLEFENVYFVKELKYNLFSVSQICDNKNSVLFTDSECIVLGKYFKLKDYTNVFLRTPRQHNMYFVDLNNVVPYKNLTCLVAKASVDESMLWHRRLGKQHKASCMTKLVNYVSNPLHTLHMDLFGPTSVSSLNHKWYCLVVTDDFSRFTWTFFLRTKDETSGILRNFITEIENLKDLKVKIIRCDNGGEFKNKEMNEFCTKKWIKREFSNARTLQQNGVAERRNRTLIEAARTMLPNAKLPTTWGSLRLKGMNVILLGTSSTNISGTKDATSQSVKKDVSSLRYIALLNWFHEAHMESFNNDAQDACNADVPESSEISNPTATSKIPPADQLESLTVKSKIPTVSSLVPTICLDNSPESSSGSRLISKEVFSQEETPSLGNALTLSNRFKDTIRVEADLSNMESSIPAIPTPTFRIHKDHLKSQIISPVDTPVQTRHKSKEMEEHRIRPIGTKWVLKNKKDERRIVIRNKDMLVAQGHTQEKGVDYEEVFAPVTRIEAIRLFLAYALFMGFTVYQMDVKSAFLYGTIDEEVYVMQPLVFQDPEFPDRVYKVEKAMYGLHQAPRSWYVTLSKYLLDNGFQRGTIDQTMFIRKHKGEFLLVQVHQVTPKECHLHAAKRIIRYLKGHLKLGLWFPKESPFDLVAYSDTDYGGATQDRKSTTERCQFLGRRLISWQCKKQTIVATSTNETEYVAAASGCGQVMWIQNQMLDYGHHFIRDCYEKKLINVNHIHTDDNVADLLTKPFDVGRFQYLVASIGMLDP